MDEESLAVYKSKGYYSKWLQIKGTKTKVISANSLSCDQVSHFLWSQLSDPNE